MQESDQTIPTTIFGKKSSAPFPCVDGIWSMFSSKGIRTIFASVGTSTSCQADLEVAEALGCPLHYVPLNEEDGAKWAEVVEIARVRERKPETSKWEFSAGADEKWVLPKNFRQQECVPWWGTGTLDCSGIPIQTENFGRWVQRICDASKLKDGEVRLDILKLDVPHGLERGILFAMLEAGFRPGLILVRWTKSPDQDVPTTLCAGHLQNCGYKLIETVGSAFCYLFTDEDIYMRVSWEERQIGNPLVRDIVQTVQKSIIRAERKRKYGLHPALAAGGETTVDAQSPETVYRTESLQ